MRSQRLALLFAVGILLGCAACSSPTVDTPTHAAAPATAAAGITPQEALIATQQSLIATQQSVIATQQVALAEPERGAAPGEQESVAAPDASASPTPPAGGTSQLGSAAPAIGGCSIFPPDNIWNTPIATLPVDPRSADYIASIGEEDTLHPDFGSGLWEGSPIGIPYLVTTAREPLVEVDFEYDDESDPGPYLIPEDAPIEGGPDSDGDRHVLVVQQETCTLYELYDAYPQDDGSWSAGSGAIYDLRSHQLRPAGWTSADAAGLPILPGLVRYDEVAAGEIRHALRFTAPRTREEYIWPARHEASESDDPSLPPMGQRFRLKADFPIDPAFSEETKVILQALKTYGMILADNGSSWFLTGEPHNGWDNDALGGELGQIPGSAFEAVDVSSLMLDPDSGQVAQDR